MRELSKKKSFGKRDLLDVDEHLSVYIVAYHCEQTADFIQCVAFDRSAEFAEKYFHQGTKLVVTGRIQTGSYTNKDGQKVYTTDVIVEDQEFAESKSASAGSDNGGYRPAMSQSRPEPASAVASGFMNIPDGVEDEGLPFN